MEQGLGRAMFMKRCTSTRIFLVFACLLIALNPVLSAPARAADPVTVPAAAGWKEYTPGRFNGLADRKVEIGADGIKATVTSRPGTGVVWEKKGTWDSSKEPVISLEFTFAETNASSDDYRQFHARFPVSVTAVFGKDRRSLIWRTRIAGFFRKIFHGFPPDGVRLTYAISNRAPVGSMYRLGDEETVFILAGDEEKGKKIQYRRNLKEDFIAAYGRAPSGPITAILARVDRPRGERGPAAASMIVTLPGP